MRKQEIFKPGNLLENGWPEKKMIVLCLEEPKEYESKVDVTTGYSSYTGVIDNIVPSERFKKAFKCLVIYTDGFNYSEVGKTAVYSVDFGVGWKIVN